MKRPRLVAGLVILIVLTLVIVAGAFILHRYQLLANSAFEIEQTAKGIDAKTQEQFEETEKLAKLLAAEKLIPSFRDVDLLRPPVTLAKSPTIFVEKDQQYQSELGDFLSSAAKTEAVIDIADATEKFGQITDISSDLVQQKRNYNTQIAEYEAIRTRFPEIVSTALGFASMKSFSLSEKPLVPQDGANNLNSFN